MSHKGIACVLIRATISCCIFMTWRASNHIPCIASMKPCQGFASGQRYKLPTAPQVGRYKDYISTEQRDILEYRNRYVSFDHLYYKYTYLPILLVGWCWSIFRTLICPDWPRNKAHSSLPVTLGLVLLLTTIGPLSLCFFSSSATCISTMFILSPSCSTIYRPPGGLLLGPLAFLTLSPRDFNSS